MKTFDLGTYTVYNEHQGSMWESYEAAVWECPSCSTVLMAHYLERTGSSPSERDPVVCPVCRDRSVQIYSAGYPTVSVLVERERRSPERFEPEEPRR